MADDNLPSVHSTGVQTEDNVNVTGNAKGTATLATEHIPLPLLNSIFGEFVDDVQNFVPTDLERGFLAAVSNAMSAHTATSLDAFTKLVDEYFGITFITEAPGGEAMFSRRAQVANRSFIMVDIGYPSPYTNPYAPSMDAYKRYAGGLSDDISTLPALPCLHILLQGTFSVVYLYAW